MINNPRRTFFRCDECCFSFLHPDLIPDEEAALTRYKQHHNDDNSKGYHQFLSQIIERALYYAGNVQTVIDWGSGPNPAASNIMRNQGLSVFSWDPYFSAADIPQKAYYDLGICIEAAEHFIQPQKDFSAFFETLKPGAFAVIHTHLAPKDDNEFLRWWYTEDITHVSYYSVRALELLGEMNNAKLITIEKDKLAVFKKTKS
jgi:hypothetical protein